ncbi:hypothetical protein E9993_11460 [Labilibacter sediminis]|nr:hypothetical protein E9993_11460 [Labilibacter sediminis]
MKSRILKLKIIMITGLLLNCSTENKPVYDTYTHHGLQREYIYYSPKSLKKKSPLVVVLHGFTSSAEKIMNYSKMNDIASSNGFAVLYPQGTSDNTSNTFWNVGYDFHKHVTIDDVDFIVQLTQFISQKFHHNPNNIFLTGMSNGAEMCYKIACEKPHSFKAIAPVAGMMLNTFLTNAQNISIPVFSVFGTADDITRFDGDSTNSDGWGAYPGIPSTIEYWALTNNCKELKIDTLKNVSLNDSSYIIRQHRYSNSNSNDVLFYKVVNGGHDWPGAWGNMDVNISEEIWHFFMQKTIP